MNAAGSVASSVFAPIGAADRSDLTAYVVCHAMR